MLKRHDKGALGVEQVTGPQHEANSAASLYPPGFGRETCRSRALDTRAKAMEGVLILESALMDLPAYGKWNGYIVHHGTGEIRLDPETQPLSGCCPVVPEKTPPISREVKRWGVERKSEEAVVVMMGGTT